MRLLLIACFLFVSHFSYAQDTSGYRLVWSDEFNNNGVPDTANWTYEQGFVRLLFAASYARTFLVVQLYRECSARQDQLNASVDKVSAEPQARRVMDYSERQVFVWRAVRRLDG